MKVYPRYLFTILALLLAFVACSSDVGQAPPDGNKNESTPAPGTAAAAAGATGTATDPNALPTIAETKAKAEETIKLINEKAEDVRKNPKKYKEQLQIIKNNPKAIIDRAGLTPFMTSQKTSIPFGIGFIAAGLFLTLMGRRIFKIFLGLSGFVVGGSVALYLVILVETLTSITSSNTVFWIIGFLGGFAGSAFFLKAWKWAIYALSAYGGVMLGMWIMGMLNNAKINIYLDRSIVLIIFGILGLFLAHYIDEFVVISGSSLSGGFVSVFGYDMIHPVGFRLFVKNAVDHTDTDIVDHLIEQSSLQGNIRICMIAICFVSVIGIYVQYRHQPRTYDRD